MPVTDEASVCFECQNNILLRTCKVCFCATVLCVNSFQSAFSAYNNA